MGKRILAIDDEKVMLKLVQAILSRAGHEVVTAGTIDDALAAMQNQHFDLITCDLMLPGISGLEFLEMMRAGTIQPSLPVIVITAAGFRDELEKARQLGAAGTLNKPFTAQQLVEMVTAIIGD